jgi:gliding motility-associated-like protein
MLVAYSASGCTDTAWAVVTIEEELIFYVPNTFTPDDDNYNQTFEPVFTSGFDPYDYHLTIFNRWGEVVFESYNHEIGWDGTYGGVNGGQIFSCQDGTYTWKIEFKVRTNDERKAVVGHVNLIR